MTIRKELLNVFAVALGVLITVQSAPAAADIAQCKPTKVSWKQEPFSKVLQFSVLCGGKWYYGRVDDAACPSISIDTAKAWLSIATAAQLSDKFLYLYFDKITGCNGEAPELNTVELLDAWEPD